MVQYGISSTSDRYFFSRKIMKYFKVSDLVVHSKCDLFQSELSQYRAHWWYGHGCELVVISRGRRIWVRMVRCPRQVLNAIEWRVHSRRRNRLKKRYASMLVRGHNVARLIRRLKSVSHSTKFYTWTNSHMNSHDSDDDAEEAHFSD